MIRAVQASTPSGLPTPNPFPFFGNPLTLKMSHAAQERTEPGFEIFVRAAGIKSWI
jgi:hypothetical protein